MYRVVDYSAEQPNDAHSEEASARWVACLERVARDGDRLAFQELFVQFAPLVKSFAYKIASLEHPEQFAEELLQETMLKVWTRSGSYNPVLASPSTWIFSIARNTRVDLLRKQARHVMNTVSLDAEGDGGGVDIDDIWFVDEQSDVFNQLAQQRSRRQIQESLRLLSPEQAFVLEKVYMEDKSHADVAEELALPLGTVKSRVRLALSKLRLLVDR